MADVQNDCALPGLYDRSQCCGETPCKLELYWPCEETGGCPDRSTCNGAWGCQDIRLKQPKETAQEKIARILRDVRDVNYDSARATAYTIAGIEPIDIAKFDAEAARIEGDRRARSFWAF